MKKGLLAFVAIVALLVASMGGIAHSGTTCFPAEEIFQRDYSNVDTSVPIFPNPQSWFKWPQRYIYSTSGIMGAGQSYLEGYGDIHPDWSYEGKTYKQTYSRNSIAYSIYIRTKPYRADFKEDEKGWSWWLKKIGVSNLGIIFKDEVLFFDYPLALNKTWGGYTTAMLSVGDKQVPIPIPVDYEAKVTRYVPEYEVPIELGLSADLDEAEAKFIDAKQLYTPDTHFYRPGCLVTELELKPLGVIPIKMEIWKDVRGCVPVQRIYVLDNLVMESMAEKWTGNIP
jgi:hypothetical protein